MSEHPSGHYPCGHASTTSDYCSVCGAQSELDASRSTEADLVAEAADLRRQRDEWKALASRYPARLEEAEALLKRYESDCRTQRDLLRTGRDVMTTLETPEPLALFIHAVEDRLGELQRAEKEAPDEV